MTWGPRDLTIDGVEVRWRPVDAIDQVDRVLLDPVERGREQEYRHAVDRDRFALGVATSRRLLGELLDLDPADVPIDRTCVDCGRPHGRPRVDGADLDLSLSHAGGWVLVGATRPDAGHARIGIDVERSEIPDADALVDGVLTSAEQRRVIAGEITFAELWVAKEAAVKATGEGLRRRLDSVEVAPDRALRWTGEGERPGRSRVRRLDSPPGHVAALVVLDRATTSRRDARRAPDRSREPVVEASDVSRRTAPAP